MKRPVPQPAVARTAPWRDDPVPSTYTPGPRSDMMVRDATILDGAGGRIDDGDALVRAGKIVAIGKALPNPTHAREIQAHGRWLTPGVIDVHSHNGAFVRPLTTIDKDSSDTSEMSDPNVADTWIEDALNPQDMGFYRARQAGVTVMQILPGSSPVFSGRSVTLKNVRGITASDMKFPDAPQGFKMACGENPKEAGAAAEREPTSREGEIALIRRAFVEAQRYRTAWLSYVAGHGAKPDRDLKKEALAGILDGTIRLNVHCYRADDMATMMSVARQFSFHITAFHHAVEAYKIRNRLRDAGVCAVVWGDWWGFKMEALDGVRANGALVDQAGGCVTMHSDSPFVGQRLNTEAAKVIGAARRVGIVIPPERAIRWITSNSAKVLGLEKRIGTLAPGYDADVVLWTGNSFSIFSQPDLVVIDGSVVFDRARPDAFPQSDFELGRTGVAL